MATHSTPNFSTWPEVIEYLYTLIITTRQADLAEYNLRRCYRNGAWDKGISAQTFEEVKWYQDDKQSKVIYHSSPCTQEVERLITEMTQPMLEELEVDCVKNGDCKEKSDLTVSLRRLLRYLR